MRKPKTTSRRRGPLPDDEAAKRVVERLNWTPYLRGRPYSVECARCSTAHESYVQQARVVGLVSREPCPGCGSHLVRRARPHLDERGTR